VAVAWFNLDLLLQEMKPTLDMIDEKRCHSRCLKWKVLEQIKRWHLLTGGTVMATMKGLDRKGTLMANTRQLKTFLMKIGVNPTDISDALLALFMFFRRGSDTGLHCIDYSILYNFYYHYANLN